MSNLISDRIPVKTMSMDNRLKKAHQEMKSFVDTPSTDSNINETSLQLEAIKNALKEISEINTARVLYFKSEIALGNYQINHDKIAKKMVHAEIA